MENHGTRIVWGRDVALCRKQYTYLVAYRSEPRHRAAAALRGNLGQKSSLEYMDSHIHVAAFLSQPMKHQNTCEDRRRASCSIKSKAYPPKITSRPDSARG